MHLILEADKKVTFFTHWDNSQHGSLPVPFSQVVFSLLPSPVNNNIPFCVVKKHIKVVSITTVQIFTHQR